MWYTSGIESFISTMETSSLMGMNVARLVVDGWEVEDDERRVQEWADVADGDGISDVPDVPDIPDVPKIPKIPKIPDIPDIPKVPEVTPVGAQDSNADDAGDEL